MLKLIAILIFSTNLSVAVETDSGWVERTYPNSEEGAEQLLAFASDAVGDTPDGVRIVVGSLHEEDIDEHIMDVLAQHEIKVGLVSPEDVKIAARKNSLPENSPIAVAHADIARFGFMYRVRK